MPRGVRTAVMPGVYFLTCGGLGDRARVTDFQVPAFGNASATIWLPVFGGTVDCTHPLSVPSNLTSFSAHAFAIALAQIRYAHGVPTLLGQAGGFFPNRWCRRRKGGKRSHAPIAFRNAVAKFALSARLHGPFSGMRRSPDLDNSTSSRSTSPPLVRLDSDTKLRRPGFPFLLNLTDSISTQSRDQPSTNKNSAAAMKPRTRQSILR